jgi:hypothetical protein
LEWPRELLALSIREDALVDAVSEEKQKSSIVEFLLVIDLDRLLVLIESLRDETLPFPKRLRDIESRLSMLGRNR